VKTSRQSKFVRSFENSPATEAALRVGDIISAIDGESTAQMARTDTADVPARKAKILVKSQAE
jgi:C-terminal processing protease CtpA/Prc